MAEFLFKGKLERELEVMDLPDAVRSLLRQLAKGKAEGFSAEITAEEVRQMYKVWRESTSTSPSGLHLGHEKALFKYEKKEGDEVMLSERIFRLKAKFINAAVHYGHLYERWTKVVNATIEKIPGKPLLHKLRVIHLIESDFNLLIGILWGRRMMAHAEKLGLLGDEQSGSRADRSAIDVLVLKQCLYSIMRLARRNGASFDNDAKSCYDRIVMLVASLCSQKMGMPKEACELFLKTLDKVRYHIKTKTGISDESYGTTEDLTMHGPGQGGRGSPSIWVTISSIIMECLRERSTGMTVSDPKAEVTEEIYSSGFVDDVTTWVGGMSDGDGIPTISGLVEVLNDMEEAAQWWLQLEHAIRICVRAKTPGGGSAWRIFTTNKWLRKLYGSYVTLGREAKWGEQC
jgi:hypothetical protein